MRYEVYLIDADDTLFDFDPAEKDALKNVFAQKNLLYTEEIRRLYREISAVLWTQFEQGTITEDELLVRRFSDLFSRHGIAADARQMNDAYVLALGAGCYLSDGAEALCKTLAENEKRIYIVTNGVSVTQNMRIGNSTIRRYISGVFVSEDVGYPKPQIEYFDYVFSQIPGFDRKKTLIVGDSLTSDIQGGLRAGVDTCWLNRDNIPNTTVFKPTYEINRLTELTVI